MKGKILLVEDDRNLLVFVSSSLKEAGYVVHPVPSADAAVALLQKQPVDLMILDIQLPGISGLNLLELLRKDERTASLPVILLTVMGAEAQKVRGLELGADDYVVKPFSMKELTARVEALLRRAQAAGAGGKSLECGRIVLSFDRREVLVKGKPAELTQGEFEVLAALMRRPGSVFGYDALREILASGGREITSGALYSHVKNLRKKLGPEGERIENVHGVGYKLTPQ